MSQYIVITGMKRTGTMFLSGVFNQNPDVAMAHEPFHLGRDVDGSFPIERLWPFGFDKWYHTDAPFVGMSSSLARCFMPEIESQVHPKWVFLWRDAFSLLEAVLAQYDTLENDFALDSRVRRAAFEIFPALEAMMLQADALNIEVHHARFEEYTTESGVRDLGEQIGIPYAYTVEGVGKNERQGSVPPAEHWPTHTRKAVKGLVESLRNSRRFLS